MRQAVEHILTDFNEFDRPDGDNDPHPSRPPVCQIFVLFNSSYHNGKVGDIVSLNVTKLNSIAIN